mgnify:FL=1|tara:strand:- start:3575 stop:4075 length:501 start_codon:yes stop_codon:yes gene_type:complete
MLCQELATFMGKAFNHTARVEMPAENVKEALILLRNPSTWPDWNRGAKSMLATNAETLDEGDHLAIHQMIKGGLIEVRWLVNSIREGEGFCEIELLGQGQSRNERPIGKGLDNLRICITFLTQEDGGIEVHSSCEVSRLMSIFANRINAFMKSQTQQLLDDLSSLK